MSISVVCPEGHPVLVDASRLGTVAHCPRCLAAFLVEMNVAHAWHARKEESKKKRARDDDDDDEDEDEDEEERPRKKAKAKKSDDDEEDEDDEKPLRKKQARRDDDDDDDEDEEEEEEEDEEEGEPQAPIKLNKLQRRLKIVHLSMTFMQIAAIAALGLILSSSTLLLLVPILGMAGGDFFVWLILIFLAVERYGINLLVVVSMVLGYWGPPKAEVGTSITSGIIFQALMLFFSVFSLLGALNMIMADPLRNQNFADLFSYFSYICEFAFFLCAMIYLKGITAFLRDMLLASEPITLFFQFSMWYLLPQIIGKILIATLDYKKIEMFGFMLLMAYGLFCFVALVFMIINLIKMIFVVIKIRDLVSKAIADA